MLRSKLKSLFSSLVGKIINLDRLIVNKRNRYILAYHRILPYEIARREYIQSSMWTTPETFEKQLKWMSEIGEIVDIERILDFEKENSKPLFSITFDDGWKDNYTYAFPILKKHGLGATIFVVTSAIDTGHLFWPEEVIAKTEIALKSGKQQVIKRFIKNKAGGLKGFTSRDRIYEEADCFLEYLKELSASDREKCIHDYYAQIGVDAKPLNGSILTWDEISEMNKYGIRFGSHSHTHAILQYCDEKTILNELITSKKILEQQLNKPIDMFCYPNARYNTTNAGLIERAGYKYAFRLHNFALNIHDSMYLIPRISVNERVFKDHSYFRFRLLGIPKY